MSTSVPVPVREGGINPIEYLRPYFTSLEDEEVTFLIGSVILFNEVKYKILQSYLNLTKLEVEEKLGRTMQTDLWEGDFTKNSFILRKLNHRIQQQTPILTVEEKIFLAYLKARFTTSFQELQEVFSLNRLSVIQELSSFICRGIISVDFESNSQITTVVYYTLPKKSQTEVSQVEKEIVGYASLRDSTPIRAISNDLQIPEHIIESSTTELILSNSIICEFLIEGSKFRRDKLSIIVNQFQISFEKRSIMMMNSTERIIIGLTTLQREVYVKDLMRILKLPRSRVLKTISYLNGTREFEFSLTRNDVVLPISTPVFQSNIAIEDIDRNSVVNYRSLIGLIMAKKEVTIAEIAEKMNISKINVLKGIVDLFLNGLIIGNFVGLEKFTLQTIRNTQEEYVTLDSWEKIIIGGLLAEGTLSMAKLGVLLNLNKELTQERALVFISRNIGKTEINNAFLTLKGDLKIPPLIQLQNLEPVDQQLFGYLVAHDSVSIKKLRNLFILSNKELYRRMYYLAGSGLVKIKTTKQTFQVKEYHEFTPQVPIDQLDQDLRKLIYHIENLSESKIRLGKLASLLDWEVDDVRLDISYLIGYGYYKGFIKGNKFIKVRGLFQFREKPKCFECKHNLDNYLEPCPNCFARPPVCSVCRSTMNSYENISMCPHCRSSAHSDHIMEWIKIKSSCPICRNGISKENLLVLET